MRDCHLHFRHWQFQHHHLRAHQCECLVVVAIAGIGEDGVMERKEAMVKMERTEKMAQMVRMEKMEGTLAMKTRVEMTKM